MRYHYISDSHVHSDCSFDGTDPVMMICERAAALGLYSIAVTDHCECDIYYKEGFDRSVVQSFFETRKARAVFYGRLQVYAGIELGQPITDPKATREALSAGAFDFVLASVHNLPGQKDFYYLNYTDENVDPLLSDYFDHVLQVAKWGQFDSLAHLTYPLRYILAQPGLRVELSKYREKIDAVLLELIQQKKALEVNTSGLRQQIGDTLPDAGIVRRFYELGGTYVTLGSDAHRWADMSAGIEEAMSMIYKTGFRHYTIYSKREPDWCRLSWKRSII